MDFRAAVSGLDRSVARPIIELMIDDDIIGVGKPPPTIAAAYPGAERRVHLVLCYPDEVMQKTVDLTPILKTGRVYAPLFEDDALFATLRVNEDGKALEFNGGFKISAASIEWLVEQ